MQSNLLYGSKDEHIWRTCSALPLLWLEGNNLDAKVLWHNRIWYTEWYLNQYSLENNSCGTFFQGKRDLFIWIWTWWKYRALLSKSKFFEYKTPQGKVLTFCSEIFIYLNLWSKRKSIRFKKQWRNKIHWQNMQTVSSEDKCGCCFFLILVIIILMVEYAFSIEFTLLGRSIFSLIFMVNYILSDLAILSR